MKNKISQYNRQVMTATAEEIIAFVAEKFGDKIAFATSLGAEDQVLTDMIAKIVPGLRIFTLDTGRLFQETYDLVDITRKKYKIDIHVAFPEAYDVEEMVSSKGPNLFYDSLENRKLCCHIRKIEPMKRALLGTDAWISGLRKEQSITRMDLNVFEWDETFNRIKVNPLINWTSVQVWDYIRNNKVPYNTLHDKGFPSIGCQPCTRAVLPGEDMRAGRWWWESTEKKECGLHK